MCVAADQRPITRLEKTPSTPQSHDGEFARIIKNRVWKPFVSSRVIFVMPRNEALYEAFFFYPTRSRRPLFPSLITADVLLPTIGTLEKWTVFVLLIRPHCVAPYRCDRIVLLSRFTGANLNIFPFSPVDLFKCDRRRYEKCINGGIFALLCPENTFVTFEKKCAFRVLFFNSPGT